jgi:Secretion system C-terminal sorting domain
MKITVSIILYFFLNHLSSQPGCTDSQALNYVITATENDGSCIYPMTNYSLTQINELPDILEECSGAELLSSGLWVHNDSGNENEIYRIDSISGEILQTVNISNVSNKDWEDFAENENYLFIGDFGNNPGNRTDLKIYRISKNDLSNNMVNAQSINFEYSDQIDFSENNNNHDFDCEAFLFYNNQLHLFTKNWVDNQTRHYTLSAEPGTHIAQLKDSFNVNGLITGADISDSNEIVLLGYTEFGFNFMWLLFDFEGDDFFSGNKRKISLGTAMTNSQTEGITFRENGYGYIVSEKFKVNEQFTLPQKLLSFSISQWIDGITSTKDISLLKSISVYPNPINGFFEIKNTHKIELSWRLYNEIGQLIKNGETATLKTNIDAVDLAAGIYYLLISNGNHRSNFTLLKK